MPYRYHGKARVNPRSPEAFGVCDRCGTLYNLINLRYQSKRAGNVLTQTRLRVCRSCMDTPQPPSVPIPSADPQPIQNPRREIQRSPYPIGEG